MPYSMSEWQKMTPEERKQAGFSNAPKMAKISTILLLITFGFFAVLLVRSCFTTKEKPPLSAAEQHTKKVEQQFSSYSGEHRKLARIIKESMNDPDSYEHVKTLYWDETDSIIIKTTIRGKNALGAKILKTYRAVADMDGNIRNITDED